MDISVARDVETAAGDMCGKSGTWCRYERVTSVLGMIELGVCLACC